MKKVILLVALVFGMNANAQLVVKNTIKDSVIWKSAISILPEIRLFSSENIQQYVMYYRNSEYTTLTDVQHITLGDKETAIEFFNVCIQVFDDKKTVRVGLNGDDISISKGMGTVMISHSKGFFQITRKQVENILEALK